MEQNKFKALEELKLTKEEALEWIEHLWKQQIVKTPVALVYRQANGCEEAYPYLDKKRKAEVVGLLINYKVWSLTGQQANVMYYDIDADVKKNLPLVHDLKEIENRFLFIKQTFAILRENGIEVEDFLEQGAYWTKQSYSIKNQDTIRVYSLADKQDYAVDPSRGKVAHIRKCYNFYKN